jgi:dTDP-4-amino-4,6-dideoxygalactose transaminase
MIPLFKVNMNRDVGKEVSNILLSGYVAQGTVVEQFEDLLWENLKTVHRPILVNSCTSSIDLALELCGVNAKEDVEVISTPQTCFASNVGAINRGAKIRWADIDPITGLIDPISVGKLINKKTRAIIAVNWAGKFCDYEALKIYGIPVIEDAAHTWDTFLENKPERGDYICYSLQAIKFLTSGDGGILITPPEKENEARLLRWYGLDRTKNESFRITQDITRVGYKYNMNDIAASIGIKNISCANSAVKTHRDNAKTMSKYLQGLDNITVPQFDENSSYWIFPILINGGSEKRESFIKYMESEGISAAIVHYRNDLFSSTKTFKENNLPGVEKFTENQINVPCGWWLSEQEVIYIIDKIIEWNKNA